MRPIKNGVCEICGQPNVPLYQTVLLRRARDNKETNPNKLSCPTCYNHLDLGNRDWRFMPKDYTQEAQVSGDLLTLAKNSYHLSPRMEKNVKDWELSSRRDAAKETSQPDAYTMSPNEGAKKFYGAETFRELTSKQQDDVLDRITIPKEKSQDEDEPSPFEYKRKMSTMAKAACSRRRGEPAVRVHAQRIQKHMEFG